MTILCMDTKCGRLAGDAGYCDAHGPQSEVDVLREQVRTLTAERDALKRDLSDVEMERVQQGDRYVAQLNALRDRVAELEAEAREHFTLAEQQEGRAERERMRADAAEIRASDAERRAERAEAVLKLKMGEADDFSAKWHEAVAAAGSARDAALEEAKKALRAEASRGEVRGDVLHGIRHSVDVVSALKAQPARRFVEAEHYEKLRDLLTRFDALLDFGEPWSAGEWGIDDPSAINALAEEARAALAEAKP